MPWPPKLLAVLVAAYAFSPIDLTPDFIPVIGLVWVGCLVLLVWLAWRRGGRGPAQPSLSRPGPSGVRTSVTLRSWNAPTLSRCATESTPARGRRARSAA